MIDLKERFDELDEVRWPDLWPAIEIRARRAEPARRPEPRFRVRRLAPVGALAVIALVIAILTTFFPRPPSALAVVQEAELRFADAPPFRAVVSGSSRAIGEEISPGRDASYVFEQVIWYDGENGWRRDVVRDDDSFRGGPGSFAVWDGNQLGEYLAETNEFLLDPEAPDERIPRTELNALVQIRRLWFGPEAEQDATAFIERACTVVGDEPIAGRPAHHLSCRETSSAAGIVETYPLEMWVDAEYGLVLRFVYQGPLAGKSEVTSIEFDPAFPASTFEVVPPAGAKVYWQGTGPTPPELRQVQPGEAVSATIPVAARPYWLQVGFGSVWVASGSTERHPTIFRLDPTTGAIVASVQVSHFGELILGEGAIWTGWCRVDPATYQVEVVRGLVAGEDVSCEPQPPPTTAEGERALEEQRALEERGTQVRGYVGAAGGGAVWAAGIDESTRESTGESTGSVLRLDPWTGEVVATIDLGTGEGVGAMAVADGVLWVTAQTEAGGSLLYRIDTRTNRIVARIELDLAAGNVVVGEGAVWLTVSPYQGGEGYDPSQGAVLRVDPQTNRVAALVPLEGSGDVAVDGGFVWVTSRNTNTVTRIDPRTNHLVGEPIVVGGEPSSIAVGHGSVWITNFADGTLARIDL